MKNKRIFLSLLILFAFNLSTFAGIGFDFGLNYSSTEIDESGAEVDREYPLSFVALPSYTSENFSIELNVPLYFKIDTSSIITFDYSTYELPESENDIVADSISYTKFFLSFLNYIQLGNFNNELALRIGKITNSTIGDGALLYHYEDENVLTFETRAGAQIKIDANKFNIPISLELITTDMFNPDLLGGRVGVNPLFFINNNFVNNISLGYTVLYRTEYNNSDTNWFDLAYDIQLPVFKSTSSSLIPYYDLISEVIYDEDDDSYSRQLSQRAGLYGWYFTTYTYDIHVKNIVESDASFDDFGSGNLDLLAKTIIPQFKPDFIISGNTGYYSNNGLSDIILSSELEFEDVSLESYNFGLTLSSEKAIGPISNLAVYAEKNFIKDTTTNQFSESFFDGFTTLKNIEATLSANIVFYQVNEIIVNVSIIGDEDGNIEPTYSLGYMFSIL
ncbi:MAG: hypothetical protein ACPKM0_06040 [Pleomorphochaeta sp.]